MLKRISAGNLASTVVSASITATGTNSLITYTTEDNHNLFIGARVTVYGLATNTEANITNGIVYRVVSDKQIIVSPVKDLTSTTAPTGTGTLWSTNGAMAKVKVKYAQPYVAKRPTYYNFSTPTIKATWVGNALTVNWSTGGSANPVATFSVTQTYSGATTSISTASSGTSSDTTASFAAGASVSYKLTATNTYGSISATAYTVVPYISAMATPVATATPGVANSIYVTWTAPTTNDTIKNYQIQRATDNTFTTNLVTLSTAISASARTYTDTTAATGVIYFYRVRAVDSTGTLTSGYTSASNPMTAYYLQTLSAVSATKAGTSVGVSWTPSSASSNPVLTNVELQVNIGYSSPGGTSWSGWSTVAQVTYTPNSYTYTPAAHTYPTAYKFRGRTYNTQLVSDWSAESSSVTI